MYLKLYQVLKLRGGTTKRKIEHDFSIKANDPIIVQECLQTKVPDFATMITKMDKGTAIKIYDRIKEWIIVNSNLNL